MNEPLRPSNLGEILDRTAQIYRARFLVFLGIALIPTGFLVPFAAAVFLCFYWLGIGGASSNPTVTGILAVLLIAVVGILFVPTAIGISALSTAAMNHAAARSILAASQSTPEEKLTIRGAYRDAWRRGWHAVGLYLLEALIIAVAPVVVWTVLVFVFAGLSALAGSAGMGVTAGVLGVLLVVLVVLALAAYALWMLLRLSLAFPACIVERIGAVAALQRSAKLSQGTRGRIFVLYLLGVAISWIVSIAVTVPLLILIALIPGSNNPQHVQAAGTVLTLLIYGSSFLVQAFVKPVYGIALMLFYYDQRIRQEGLDIEWMMQRAGMFPALPPHPSPNPLGAPGPSLLGTWESPKPEPPLHTSPNPLGAPEPVLSPPKACPEPVERDLDSETRESPQSAASAAPPTAQPGVAEASPLAEPAPPPQPSTDSLGEQP